MSKSKIVLLITLITLSKSFYEGKSSVILLDKNSFEKEVVQSKDIWLIEFFAPWCGHCKNFAPEYEKAARALKGIFKIGAVNADSEKELAGKYGIQGFPTVKFFGITKTNIQDYNGARSAQAIINYMFDRAKDIVNKRMGQTTNTNSNQKTNTNSNNNNNNQQKKKPPSSDKDVLVLDDKNFDETIFKSKEMFIVAFYAPWCGHCQKLLPEWNAAATQLKGQIKLAKVDATVNQQLASRYQIQGYPTIKIFPPGDKTNSNIEEYNGPRDEDGIVQYALSKLNSYGYVPDIPQLVNNDILKETCEEKSRICILVFLPHIADSSKNERNKYLDYVKNSRKDHLGKPIYYLWAQGGDYFDLEDKLHLGFGYPAVVALNYNKKKYAVCRKAFTQENLSEFVSGLLRGREALMNLPELPKLKNKDLWDGNDAPKVATEKEADDL
jgi:protein disulfide-isomerase A6